MEGQADGGAALQKAMTNAALATVDRHGFMFLDDKNDIRGRIMTILQNAVSELIGTASLMYVAEVSKLQCEVAKLLKRNHAEGTDAEEAPHRGSPSGLPLPPFGLGSATGPHPAMHDDDPEVGWTHI